jgi:hypothetical protein
MQKDFLKMGTRNGNMFSNEYLDVHNGVIDGFSYYHPYQQRKRSDYFIVRRWRIWLNAALIQQ